MRIIYVEDDLANVALVERICNMSKDEVIHFVDAADALAEIEPDSANLILMDIHLGNWSIDGLELTRLLRRKGIDVPIIAVTAYDSLGYAEQYQSAGCDLYISKPISISHMINLLDTHR